MNYEEYITDIQQAAKEYLSTGNIIFGILLLIGIIAGLLFFFIYVRKEYYRKTLRNRYFSYRRQAENRHFCSRSF